MNNVLFDEFIKPFTTMGDYMTGLYLIKQTFSSKTKNYVEVSKLINNNLSQNINEFEIKKLIDQLEIYPKEYGYDYFHNNDRLLQKLHADTESKGMASIVLAPEIKQCQVCTSKAQLVVKKPKLTKEPILYAENSIGNQAEALNSLVKIDKKIACNYLKFMKVLANISTKHCKSCGSFHYLSFVVDASNNSKHYYENSHLEKYFQITTETIFETSLLQAINASFFFQHCSFRNFSETYNYRYAHSANERFKLNYKRLCEVFYTWHLVKFYKEFYKITLTGKNITDQYEVFPNLCIFNCELVPSGESGLDDILDSVKPTLANLFTQKWSSEQNHPRSHSEDCSKTITIDGCWKCTRTKCCYDDVFYKTVEFGDIPVGCTETPLRGSYYCDKHSSHELKFNVDGQVKRVKPKDIKPTKISKFTFILYIIM
jgi:hypothetical protein